MKKRVIAFAGGAALVAAAAVPVGSAFAQPSRQCQQFLKAEVTAEGQQFLNPVIRTNPQVSFARGSQFDRSGNIVC